MNPEGEAATIRYLADLPSALPELARWFVEEWEPYYGPSGPGDATLDLQAAANKDRLPLCLVAVDRSGALAGSIALKQESIASHRRLSPWIAAFLVAPQKRGRGIGTELLAAAEAEARRLGYKRIYVASDTAEGMLRRRGWRAFDQGETLRGPVPVYRLDLSPEPAIEADPG